MDFESTLDLQSLIELLKNYDFINNSVRKFSLEHIRKNNNKASSK